MAAATHHNEPDVAKTPELTQDALFKELGSSPGGLPGAEAKSRLEKYGPNALEEKKTSALLQFLGYFRGPIPWMIEVAAVLSAMVGHWVDLIIITVLRLFNAIVAFWQEHLPPAGMGAHD